MIDAAPPRSYRRAWTADAGHRVTDAIEHLAAVYADEEEAFGGPLPIR